MHIRKGLQAKDATVFLPALNISSLVQVDAREHGPGGRTDPPQIRAKVEGLDLLIGLLGSAIPMGAEPDWDLTLMKESLRHLRRMRYTKIRQYVSASPVEQDVRRLDVEMQDRSLVGSGESAEQVADQAPGLIDIESPDERANVGEAPGREVLHDGKGDAAAAAAAAAGGGMPGMM